MAAGAVLPEVRLHTLVACDQTRCGDAHGAISAEGSLRAGSTFGSHRRQSNGERLQPPGGFDEEPANSICIRRAQVQKGFDQDLYVEREAPIALVTEIGF